jgi:hypothetical protein
VNVSSLRPAEFVYFDEVRFGQFLDTLEADAKLATEVAIKKILPRAKRIEASKWVKPLGGPLMQFRIGPTTTAVMSQNMTPSGHIAQRQPLLVRIFFVYEGEHKIIVLHAYDKTKDRTRLSQQREIAEAKRILEKWSASRG